MRTKNVVVLESNVTLQQELKEAMESSEELRVVYAGDDGERGSNKSSSRNRRWRS